MEIIQETVEPSTHEVLGSTVTNPPTPRNGYLLPALGKQFPVSSLENRIIGQFEMWAEGEVLKSIHETSMVNMTEADAQRSVFQGDKLAGHYKWDVFTTGKHILTLRASNRGFLHLLYLLLNRCNPKITELDAKLIAVDNPQGCLDAIRWAQGNWESREKEALGLNRKTTVTTDQTSEATTSNP